MKKVLTMLLCLTLVASCLAGCSSSTSSSSSSEASVETTVETEAVESEAVEEVAGVTAPDGYPSGTITWIVPAAAGAAIDLPTRAIADLLDFGTIVVENIAGASQTLGTAEAAVRDADGLTLLTMANACGITQPILNSELAYSMDDFRFIAMMTPSVQATICVKKGSSITNIEELLAYIQENSFVFAVPNAGGYGDVAITTALDQLGIETGKKMAYDGSNDAIAAVLNGEALFSCTDSTDAVKHLDELEVIAILDSNTCSLMPDVPALGDYGVENLEVITGLKWVAVRADTPDDIVEYLKVKLNEVIESDAYQEYLVTMGYMNEGDTFEVMTEEEVTAIVEEAGVVYKEIMEKAGMI